MTETRPYVRAPHRTAWYLSHRRYMQHMAQELTCVFIGAYALVLLWAIGALAAGETAWLAFLQGLGSPLALMLQWLVLLVTLYHTVSWFAVTPKAMPIQIGERFLPGAVIAGAHYVVWVILSLAVLYFAGVF